jgi:MutS2 family protein
MIAERSLRVLEFTKIREQLAALALTPSGAELCQSLIPYDAFDLLLNAQAETEEAAVILTFIGGHPMAGFSDVRPYLELCEKGATLSPKALLEVATLLRAIRSAKKMLVTERDNTPLLTQKAGFLGFFGHLEEEISSAILSEDEIADKASGELYDIRRNKRKTSDKVREKLNSMIRSATFQKYLQDPIVTMRQDRYVLPVKQEYRAQVPGLVHDQSSSGATLFIEPMAVVELNNDLKQWEAKEKAEIERILQALSAQIAPSAEQLKDNFLLLSELDFAFAKGLLAREMKAVRPKINDKGILRLKRARHPLIDPKKVVPSDLWLGQDFTTLIITGPNTGGKTVTLKTVGLLTLMAQAGLQVPADIGTELAFFETVYADIGDEQSIEQSLSTFSSHMTNIVDIVNNVTSRDLALFDELGAGTDPTEGAALAQSILSELLEKQVRSLATTHYSELKAFALSTRGVENASVEFNVETLRPTYRLSIGVPGKSNAFEISRKLGLPESIIDKSKELLSNETIRFEDVIANAEYHRQIAEKERLLAEEAHLETQRLKDAAERLRREMEDKRETAMKKAREDAKRVMENARRESEEIISELKKMKKEGAVTQDHKAAELRHRMQQGLAALSEGLTQKNPSLTAPPKDLNPGDLVDIVHLNQRGTVLSKPDQKGEVQLQAGILKLKAHISQLRLVNEEAPKKKSVAKTQTGAMLRTVPSSFDVRGMALDEALPEVDRYLDEAVMAGLNEVTIVHGKGTGILRTGIQQHLKRHGHVKNHRLGIYGEGETGVTVVTLK